MSDPVAPVLLDGELNFATVPQFLGRFEQLLDGKGLDLSRVTHADSAGLALLLELTRRHRASTGAELILVGATARILQLAEFFGLDKVLRFQDGASNAQMQGEQT